MANKKTNIFKNTSANRVFQKRAAGMISPDPSTDEMYQSIMVVDIMCDMFSTQYGALSPYRSKSKSVINHDETCDHIRDLMYALTDAEFNVALDRDDYDHLQRFTLKCLGYGKASKGLLVRLIRKQFKGVVKAISEMDPQSESDSTMEKFTEMCKTFTTAAFQMNDIIIRITWDLVYAHLNEMFKFGKRYVRMLDNKTGIYKELLESHTINEIADIAIETISAYDVGWKTVPIDYYRVYGGKETSDEFYSALAAASKSLSDIVDLMSNLNTMDIKLKKSFQRMVIGWVSHACMYDKDVNAAIADMMPLGRRCFSIGWTSLRDILNLIASSASEMYNENTTKDNITGLYMRATSVAKWLMFRYSNVISGEFVFSDDDRCSCDDEYAADLGFESPFNEKPTPLNWLYDTRKHHGNFTTITTLYSNQYENAGSAFSELSLHVFDRVLFMDLIELKLTHDAKESTLRDGMRSIAKGVQINNSASKIVEIANKEVDAKVERYNKKTNDWHLLNANRTIYYRNSDVFKLALHSALSEPNETEDD